MKKLSNIIILSGLSLLVSVSAYADATDKIYKDVEKGSSVILSMVSQSGPGIAPKFEFNYGPNDQEIYYFSYRLEGTDPSVYQLGTECKLYQDYMAALTYTIENNTGSEIAISFQGKYKIKEAETGSMLLKGKLEYGVFTGFGSANPDYSLFTIGTGLQSKIDESLYVNIGYFWFRKRILNTNIYTGNAFFGAEYYLEQQKQAKFFADYIFANGIANDLFELGFKYSF
jgi:hypothetical protein